MAFLKIHSYFHRPHGRFISLVNALPGRLRLAPDAIHSASLFARSMRWSIVARGDIGYRPQATDATDHRIVLRRHVPNRWSVACHWWPLRAPWLTWDHLHLTKAGLSAAFLLTFR